MGRLVFVFWTGFYLNGCVTPSEGPFLSEADFATEKRVTLNEEEVNKLMFKIISQLGVPQNFLTTTSQGGLVAATGGGMSLELTCPQGVEQFAKRQASGSLSVYLDFDARPCFDQVLEQADQAQRQKMKLLMDLRQMRTRIYTQTACELDGKTDLKRLTAEKYLTDGSAGVCTSAASNHVLMNYEVTIDAMVMGQPFQTNAKLLIARSDAEGCEMNISANQDIDTDGCAIMMRLGAPQGRDFVMVVKSRGVKGSLNLPYFSAGYYDVILNGWTGRVTFGVNQNPVWNLSRDDQLAQGEFDGRGIITH